ncbi:hypothetical protein JZ751_018546 [Albula glossodonta]|uniref:Kinesin motor domain-containing protein n=1 Tax=Albula glossodonta TaxID=121402 RepID=A0A8T2NP30_9TELE|nr:hypothetical protein JZ751_018546 [Albula glossodonta]
MSQNLNMSCKKEEKGRNIQVVVRCRPLNSIERKSAAHGVLDCDQGRKEVVVRTGGFGDKGARKTYTFDMVFGPSAKQIEVYRSVVFPILDEVIMGYNCTVFAYGQTGTGKTFTMEGERSSDEGITWEEDPLAGIIPRTLHQIFEILSKNGTEFSVKVSLLEIYNEELFDLLSPSPDVNERLQMFDDPRNKRGVVIKGLEEVTVHNKDEVYHILERGAAKRKTASTLMNAYSSRSHSVFSLTIHMKEITVEGEELVKIGKLNLVDLAGSENIGRSGAVEKRAREAGNINQSLLTLGRVITALVERTPHIPYRESKLTRILQDSLGGRTKTSIIATVSPASINLEETLSTLDYANRAKNIINKPEVNQKLTKRTLIKEYTEEIERLKRDLSAAREKNGVFVSVENYEAMNSRIVSQEEQITEFSDKISAMEEELKKVAELFSDSKHELEQCMENLQVTRQSLEEAQRDLELTKQKLSEEKFIVSALKTTEKSLYCTAQKLMTTVDTSTKDVTGLHEKLDRKKSVEQYNAEVQQKFANQMEEMFTQTQKTVEEQSVKQQNMLNSYKNSVANLLKANDTTFSGAISTVSTSFKSIRDLVSSGMSKCQAEMMEQETLCQEAKSSLQSILEEHKLELEEKLLAVIVPGLTAMETMKSEMSSFFREHTQALGRLRDTSNAGFSSLQKEQDSLKQKITNASKKHETRMSQVISCLQNQLNLLGVDSKTDFDRLLNLSEALQGPVESLKQTVQSDCTAAVQKATEYQGQVETTAAGLVSEIQCLGAEAGSTVEKCSSQCGLLQGSLIQLGQDAKQRCDAAMAQVQSLSEQQLSLIKGVQESTVTLQQNVAASCEGTSQDAGVELKQRQEEVEGPLRAMERQTGEDQTTLQHHSKALFASVDASLSAVHSFLTEELRKDLPTGVTPQRKEYDYPTRLARSRTRSELLESFRAQQQELLASLAQCEPVEEESVEQEPQEAEVSSVNDLTITEQSDTEELLMCSEGGAPFFKRKNGGKKKENKAIKRSKTAENENPSSPSQTKMPLRMQN